MSCIGSISALFFTLCYIVGLVSIGVFYPFIKQLTLTLEYGQVLKYIFFSSFCSVFFSWVGKKEKCLLFVVFLILLFGEKKRKYKIKTPIALS